MALVRKCKNCKAVELPPAAKCDTSTDTGILHKKGFCDYPCLVEHTRKKNRIAEEKKKRKQHQADKLRVKTAKEIKPLAQDAFNEFIRLLDRNEPCISCGRPEHEVVQDNISLRGGVWDCGHFLSRGAREELRFTIYNAYKQCKTCNGGSGNYAKKNYQVAEAYEQKLRKKWGDELVDWLQGPHELPHYTKDDYLRIRDYCRGMVNIIKKQIRNGQPAHTRLTFYGLETLGEKHAGTNNWDDSWDTVNDHGGHSHYRPV